MDFLILPYIEAKRVIEKFPKKLNVISCEKDLKIDSNLCKHHLILKFDDIDDRLIARWDKQLKIKKQVYPEKEDIIKAIEFAKLYKIHIIHCAAGISRSPAIGYAIFRSRGLNKESALDEVREIAPFSSPNERIVRFVDEIYGI